MTLKTKERLEAAALDLLLAPAVLLTTLSAHHLIESLL